MLPSRPPSPVVFIASLLGLAALPCAPEICLLVRNHEDLKYFAPVLYYEGIVSFLLLAPVLLLGRWGARIWVGSAGIVMGTATLVTGFQAVSGGARWDPTAHAALLQTSPGEAAGFLRAFMSPATVGWSILIVAGFAVGVAVNCRAVAPSRRVAGACLLGGLLFSSYGVHNAIKYTGDLRHAVSLSDGSQLQIIDVGINKFHPVTLLAVTHYNYQVTHDYYLRSFHAIDAHRAVFQGAHPVAGATNPRLVVVVIGESASRRHWSLYGYARDTTPELRRSGGDGVLFSDVISSSVGTQAVLRSMFSTNFLALPVFPLFSAAGYKTHWLSAQYNQGVNDVEIAALLQSCDQRVFLNGAYDGSLLPFVRAAMDEPGRHVIFVNLFGSHVRYADRYPAEAAVFSGEGEKDGRIATYDNSIRYTDHVLAELVRMLRARHDASCLLYASDHAEDVYDSTPDTYLFRSEAIATNAMYEVPFYVWFSPEYREGNAAFVAGVAAARDRKFQTEALYHSIIDLSRLTHPLYDSRLSVFSPDFVERPRRVGAMARVYTK